MKRFFCASGRFSGQKVVMEDNQQVHYLKSVLRLKPKEKIIVFDELHNEYDCLITEVSQRIVLNIQAKRTPKENAQKLRITVACAIPKKAKIDEVIDKLTQLGVERIIPMETERTEIKLNKEKKAFRKVRWEKIAQGASQQSQRSVLPVIEAVKKFPEVLAESAGYELQLIAHLGGERRNLKEVFAASNAKNIIILIGPEGDFTDGETKAAQSCGFIPVSLGELVLRVDTACIAAVSFLNLYAHG